MEMPEWYIKGECRSHDPDLWYPEKGDRVSEKLAKKHCLNCPVRNECLGFALENDEPWGIWGALLPRERRSLQRRQRKEFLKLTARMQGLLQDGNEPPTAA